MDKREPRLKTTNTAHDTAIPFTKLQIPMSYLHQRKLEQNSVLSQFPSDMLLVAPPRAVSYFLEKTSLQIAPLMGWLS
ncbi:hypothetical protein AQUCO_01200250v1 [Aquilegia coerulea]|uniref:Uncharacterized protein n=1 Tax=Aquilegia coerulea TaxID=218851 RepID=A0A2G5E4Y3_AQUCA|nr:hypothetical protein AQUCO_01200250v1 [Aquilegia coerulea]